MRHHILSLAMTVSASAAHAASPTSVVTLSSTQTGRLVQACEGVATDLRETFCTGYILAALDAFSIEGAVCPAGTGATTITAVAVARKYLSDHPQQWGDPPIVVLRRALQDTFPCPRHSDPATARRRF